MPVVRVFVLDSEDRVLLVKTDRKRGPEHIFWIVPGGIIEPGEFSRDAAIREVKEETGLDIAIKRLVWVEEGKNDKGEVGDIHYYQGEVINGEKIVGTDPELDPAQQVITGVEYMSREEIQTLPIVYPEVLLHDYFWETIRSESHDPYVNRPSKGFGMR